MIEDAFVYSEVLLIVISLCDMQLGQQITKTNPTYISWQKNALSVSSIVSYLYPNGVLE